MMRISTSQIYGIANVGMSTAQTEINKTQEQMSSGKRVLSPADDPIAATSILQINEELSRLTQYSRNIDLGTNSLSLEDTTLQSVVGLVQRMQELAVASGNTAVLTKADYKALAAEVESRTQELLNLQNTRNASGQYIFSGYQGSTQPFVDNGGGNYSYKGDDGQLFVKASASVKVAVTDSGKRLFADIPSTHNTVISSSNPFNKGIPPAFISAGIVYDQEAFDKFYPESMAIAFNANEDVVPPAPNFTITERSTGKVLVANQLFTDGDNIELNGVRFQIYGAPTPGTAAKPSLIPLGNITPTDFSVTASSLTLRVGGVTETLTLDQNITSVADMITAMGGDAAYPNANPLSSSASAQANYLKLQNLGLTFDANGFSSARGLPVSVQGGSAATNQLLGITTSGGGTGAAIKLVNTGASFDFTPPNQRDITIDIGGKTETLTLSQNVTNMASLVAAISAGPNAAKLTNLGLTINNAGILSSATTNAIRISGGDLQINSVMGIETTGTGTVSAQGTRAVAGDSFFVDSTNKQGLLTTLARFSQAMRDVENTSDSKDALKKIIDSTLSDLNSAIENLTSVQGDVGARMNTLETTQGLNVDTELFSKEVLSNIESLDYAEASTRLSIQSLVLSATQQSFVKISQLNLFSYL